jgi:hypothetical protein
MTFKQTTQSYVPEDNTLQEAIIGQGNTGRSVFVMKGQLIFCEAETKFYINIKKILASKIKTYWSYMYHVV